MTLKLLTLCLISQLSSVIAFGFLDDVIRRVTWERCTSTWISLNVTGLVNDLNTQLYGQPLVKRHVISLLESHMDPNFQPSKALVLSFHGPPGTGKNFVSDIIVNNIFHLGTKSKFRRFFSGRSDFPSDKLVDKYKVDLKNSIMSQGSDCERSIFVFDEIEKVPEGLTDALKPFLDYYPVLHGTDFRKSIFIFLSNIASSKIYDRILQLYDTGMSRSDFTSSDFEEVLRTGAFNEEGGFRHSSLIPHHLIDSYVPFLPLEKEQIVQCISKEAARFGIHLKPGDTDDILEEVVFKNHSGRLFSITGCKTIASKVQVHLSFRRSFMGDEL